MTLAIDIITALIPLAFMVYAMLRLRWNGAQAGVVSWGLTLLLAALQYRATPAGLFWAQVRGLFQALYVLYIIWGALIFYRVTEATGAIRSLTELLAHLTPQQETQVLLLAWVFASFLQSVGGYGVPIAVTAPLLLNFGLSPALAVTLPSLGHAWAVSFGSLGASYSALVSASGVQGLRLNVDMALVLVLVCWVGGVSLLALLGGSSAVRRQWRWLVLLTTVMGGVQLLTAALGWPHGAALLGTLSGMAVASVDLINQSPKAQRAAWGRVTLTALFPYAVLVALIVLSKQWPGLDALRVSVTVPETVTQRGWVMPAGETRRISVLGHAGALLIYAAVVCYVYARARGTLAHGTARELVRKVFNRRQWMSTLALLSMAALATTMESCGMMDLLARATATTLGKAYTFIAPWIGTLGAFVTGNNTSSNVLFGAFQRNMAMYAGVSVTGMLALHNAGAAIGSIFAPAKIIVGCSTVGLEGQEGLVWRYLLKPALLTVALVSALALLII